MAYQDEVLLKLRRDYSKDEVVMYALNKIKELQTENGKLHSYITELEDGADGIKDKMYQEQLERNAKLIKEIADCKANTRRKKVLKICPEEVINLKSEIGALKKANRVYVNKNMDLNNKLRSLLTNPTKFNTMSIEDKLEYLKNVEFI